MRLRMVIGFFGGILALAVIFLGINGARFYQPLPINSQEPQVLVIPPNTSAKAFVNLLYARHLVTSPRLFLALIRCKRSALHLKAGIYALNPQDSLMQLLQNVVSGKVLTKSFCIIEGTTVDYIQLQLQHASYLKYQQSDWSKIAPNQLSKEGLLLADTYIYDAGTLASDLLKRAHQKLEHDLALVWKHRDLSVPYKSAYELLIAASILEKESALPTERRLISGVIINRLQKHMPLQMDPTVIYALGSKYQKKLKHADLSVDSPYNTYRNRGLPPTPIAMVGHDALDAAAHPTPSEYLYFVAKSNGTHQFSVTYEEQRKAIAGSKL